MGGVRGPQDKVSPVLTSSSPPPQTLHSTKVDSFHHALFSSSSAFLIFNVCMCVFVCVVCTCVRVYAVWRAV